MGVESEMWGNAGGGHTLTYNGKTYTARLIDGEVKAKFEKRLYARARAVEAAMLEDRGSEAYQKRLDVLADAYLCGEFDIMSPRGLKFLQTLSGQAFLLSLLVDCDEKEVYGLGIAKTQEVISLLKVIIRESFPGLDPFKTEKKEEAKDVASTLAQPLTTKEIQEAAQGPK